MIKYLYTNSNPCHINLDCGDGNIMEASLYEGEVYELPTANVAIQRMITTGDLKPVYKTKKTK